jgi:MFS family permease
MHSPVRAKLGLPLWAFIIATTSSFTGAYVQKIAIGWSVWEMTHATFWVAAVAMADLLPTLVISIPAGAIVDRFDPAKTFWVCQAAVTLQAIALCALAASGHLDLGLLFACVIFLGASFAFSWPSRVAYLMQLTPSGSFKRVVALNSIAGNMAFFLGPMIGGEILSRFGVTAAFAVNAAAFVPMIALAFLLPRTTPADTKPVVHRGAMQSIREGFVFALRHREILTMLLAFAAAAVTARGIMELAPSIAATALHGDVKTLSYLSSSIGLGALLAGLWMSRGGGLSGRKMIVLTLAGSAFALLGFGASGQREIALAGGAMLGFALAINNISVTSALQLYTPADYRGRINALYNMIFRGGPAVGALVFGWLAQTIDVRVASVAAAILLIVMTTGVARLAAPAGARGAEDRIA